MINKYDLKEFKDEMYAKDLIDFYMSVLGLNDYCPIEWNNVVFASKKAFQMYLLLVDNKIIDINKCKVNVYLDTYIINNIDDDLFKNENVCIIDDTLIEIEYLEKIYENIKNSTSANTIFIKVFMQSDNIKKIEFNTSPVIITNTDKIIDFSIKERMALHNELIPFTADLPVITEVNKKHIELTEEEYNLLKKDSCNWQYIEGNPFEYTERGKIINSSLIMKNSAFLTVHSAFINLFTVQLQVIKKDNNYRIVATPIAYFRNTYFEDIYNFFMMLYKTHEYGIIVEDKKNKLGNNFAKLLNETIYNEVRYNLSYYIGYEFISKLTSINPKLELDFLNNFNAYSYNNSFLEATIDIFKNQYPAFIMNSISFEEFKPVVDCSMSLDIDMNTKFYDINIVYLLVLRAIEKVKYQSGNKFISIEQLEQYIINLYYINMDDELKIRLFASLNSILEQNGIRDTLIYDDKKDVIYSGIEPVRDNELLVTLFSKYFYIAVKEYYDNIDKDKYSMYYHLFISRLFQFFEQNGMYENLFSKEELLILIDIFEEDGKSNVFESINDKEALSNTDSYVKKMMKEYIRDISIYED